MDVTTNCVIKYKKCAFLIYFKQILGQIRAIYSFWHHAGEA